jgi:hypothetical protein
MINFFKKTRSMKLRSYLMMSLLACNLAFVNAQDDGDKSPAGGVAVSPSTLRFTAKPGTPQMKTIKVTNDSKRKCRFQISFQDVGMDKGGKQEVAVNETYRYALSKYLVVSPSYIELNPGEFKVIEVTANIPGGDSTSIAMWTTLVVDEVRERGKMEVPNPNNKTIGLGIYAGIGFGVNVYQNPANVAVNSVEIMQLRFNKAAPQNKNLNNLIMNVKNTGDGIGYCLYYVELTNLVTGKQSKLKVKQFGVLPGYSKEIRFDLPKELAKGKYSGMAVLDFGDKEVLQTAEIEFNLQ